MKKKVLLILASIWLILPLNSCSKEEECDCVPPVEKDSLIIQFNALTNGVPAAYQIPYTDPINRLMRISFLQMYVSNVFLLNGDQGTQINEVSLLTFVDKPSDLIGKTQEIKLLVPAGTYTGMKFGIGLNAEQNAMDPGSFDAEHPMSSEQKTYWDGWSKYRFFMIEGRLDTAGSGNLNYVYGYHTGFDTCYREKTFSQPIEIQSGVTNRLTVNFDINDVFFGNDTLDILLEPSWHGDPTTVDRAIRISDNLYDALQLEP